MGNFASIVGRSSWASRDMLGLGTDWSDEPLLAPEPVPPPPLLLNSCLRRAFWWSAAVPSERSPPFFNAVDKMDDDEEAPCPDAEDVSTWLKMEPLAAVDTVGLAPPEEAGGGPVASPEAAVVDDALEFASAVPPAGPVLLLEALEFELEGAGAVEDADAAGLPEEIGLLTVAATAGATAVLGASNLACCSPADDGPGSLGGPAPALAIC
jgi:hypothetical protein